MSYISQSIVFTLALLGIFFKSIKTDEMGRNVHSRSGLLVLTRPGQIIVTLLILSFIVSMITTIQNSRAAKAREEVLNASLSTVTGQNQQLLATVNEQSKQNLGEFDQQRKKLVQVTETIDNSAGTLLSNLRSTSNVLGDRLNTSIGLLQFSQKEIERAANPIKDVYISFSAMIPMDSPPFTKFRENFSRRLDDLVKNSDPDQMEVNHVKFIGPPVGDNFVGVNIERGSPLLPDPQSEPYVFNMLNCIQLHIDFYKTGLSLEEMKGKSLTPDLTLNVAPLITPHKYATPWAEPGMELQYFFQSPFVFVDASNIPVRVNHIYRTPKIISIPDLRNARVIVSLSWGMFLRDTDWKAFSDDFARIKLSTFSFRLSGGLVLQCNELIQHEKGDLPSFACKLPPV